MWKNTYVAVSRAPQSHVYTSYTSGWTWSVHRHIIVDVMSPSLIPMELAEFIVLVAELVAMKHHPTTQSLTLFAYLEVLHCKYMIIVCI